MKKKKMKKSIKQWFSANKKMIGMVFLLLVAISILSFTNQSVFAQINQANGNTAVDSFVGTVLKAILNFGSGVLLTPFATLLTGIAFIVFIVLYLIFQTLGMTNGVVSFPFPDNIVFNRMAFFDPNFINPTTADSAPVRIMQNVISSMYYSFFIIAISIFVIAAMVIGIKLALSSIASEKAQYKQALTNWVFGIVLLFTVHFLMAAIFALNESIVAAVSQVANGISFEVSVVEMIPVAGNTLSKIIGSVDAIFGTNISGATSMSVPGYGGLILMFAVKAFGGDFLSSITLFIIMGQTIALVVMYTKRLFYCIFLGMMAPLIVAVDVIRKSVAK